MAMELGTIVTQEQLAADTLLQQAEEALHTRDTPLVKTALLIGEEIPDIQGLVEEKTSSLRVLDLDYTVKPAAHWAWEG
ncbi:hypothetical protein DL546_005924 [Coniochaeta pulveracea]|uniref:Uncharacterized protein n=1 Tax=Coniochaeta pulveracea TaxID=177199 RepID=A0A420YGY7_9PEZI|nr:hypothetical protein DL546_005924 [Coniochaeta pulveracea]